MNSVDDFSMNIKGATPQSPIESTIGMIGELVRGTLPNELERLQVRIGAVLAPERDAVSEGVGKPTEGDSSVACILGEIWSGLIELNRRIQSLTRRVEL